RRGDIVQIDTGLILDGYCSDLSRVFSVGRPTPTARAIHQIVLEAQRRAIDAIRDGVKAKDVDAKARRWMWRKGYSKAFGHGTGHGLGLEIHEAPAVNARSDAVLRSGMVVTVEPGIYLPGWGGIRIEDVVVVRRDGCEVLTASPKEIAVV
ncbi:MAG: M24 family metallopeptidase, partial [Candidatus Sumerlaeota bacterium]|nr:M24 family metallopeptidase [Candidatus Sumerlaeota bacterium]